MVNIIEKINKQSGQVMLTLVIMFLFASMVIVFGIVNPILKQVAISKTIMNSSQSFFLAESSLEDVVYRLQNNKQLSSAENLSLDGSTVSTLISDIVGGKQIISTASKESNFRKLKARVQLGTGISFHYGVQSGRGGFELKNSSSIVGNVFSAGPIIGAGNYIYGDVVSAGVDGLIDGVHATGTAYAHNIRETSSNQTIIDKDAFYTNIDADVEVNRTLYPGSPDQDIVDLPISDEQIEEWENDAVTGGVLLSTECDSYSAASNTCTISSTKTLGPIKIPFNLLIKTSSGVLTVAGPIWVTGDITTQTGPTIKILASLGNKNVPIIADNPSDRTGSGIIDIGQSTIFQGSGSATSFVFLISQNNSAETGGSVNAISLNQGASAMVAYASHGQITLAQSVNIKEATAWKIILTQSAKVIYDKGLPSTLFESGPSGGYDILEWREIQ